MLFGTKEREEIKKEKKIMAQQFVLSLKAQEKEKY
jgi:hypothetical protein